MSFRPNELTKLRNLQINALRQKFPHSRFTNGGTTMDIPLIMRNKAVLTFRIIFGERFPNAPPRVVCLGMNGYVNHPQFSRWGINCNLALIIHEIFNNYASMIQSGKIKPIIIPAQKNNNPHHHQNNARSSGGFNNQNRAPPRRSANGGGQQLGSQRTSSGRQFNGGGSRVENSPPPRKSNLVVPEKFKEIDNLAKYDAKSIVQDEKKLRDFVKNLDCLKNTSMLIDQVKKSNVQQARENLSKEENYTALKRQTLLSQSALKIFYQKYNENLSKKKSITTGCSPSALVEMINEKIEESETNCEQVATQFLSRKIDVTTYLKNFQEARKLYYRRILKKEKFEQSLIK